MPHDDLLPLSGFEQLNNVSPPVLKIWLGTAGATTPLHYDSQTNVYAQLHGEKHVLLLPPEVLESALYLHPRFHPLSHFSRLTRPLDPADAAQRAAFPRYAAAAESLAHSVLLQAGDVLFLPPFWAHHAECQRECVSVNAWFASADMSVMAEVDALPLPFESEWPPGTLAAACLRFMTLLVLNVPGPTASHSSRSGGAVRQLLDGRWRQPARLLRGGVEAEVRAKVRAEVRAEVRAGAEAGVGGEEEELRCSPSTTELTPKERSKLGSYAARRAAVLARISERVRETLLADHIEQLAHWLAAGSSVRTLRVLRRLARCYELAGADEAVPESEPLLGPHPTPEPPLLRPDDPQGSCSRAPFLERPSSARVG